MGVLTQITSAVPNGWDDSGQRISAIVGADLPAERRAWKLWLESEWSRHAGAFRLAHQALDAAEEAAESTEWTPTWGLETSGLRGKLFQDGGEPAQAYDPVHRAMEGWLLLGQALEDPNGASTVIVESALRGAEAMVNTIVRQEYLEPMARDLGASLGATASALWLTDRMAVQAEELIDRGVKLEAQVVSYSAARQAANDALATARSWSILWRPLNFEIGLRLTLSGAAAREQKFAAAIGQADDGLALTEQMPEGPERQRYEAELRSNRAVVLASLGRSAEAAAEFDRAAQGLKALGATADALGVSVSTLRARDAAREIVRVDEVRQLTVDIAAAAKRGESKGGLMADFEYAQRWLLSMLAEEPTQDLAEVMALFETLHDSSPVLRAGTGQPDPVVARMCRPFTVLGARFGRLRDTALVVVDPGLGGERLRPPVFLAASSGGDGEAIRWRLVPDHSAGKALRTLQHFANAERERLLTGELPLHAASSESLRDAASAAWQALPDAVREAIQASRTLLYMPSAAESVDAIPFELLLHEGGWLGTTHVVVRCPSLQYLDQLLAPGAEYPIPNSKALVACPAQDERLGLLAGVDAEVDLALKAAALLGLDVERMEMTTPASVFDAFTGRSLVHYIGHGFANTVGEWLPLSNDSGVFASELPERDAGPAPFTFFNACLLGRIRYVQGGSGGQQRGWALRLLDQGAPGIIGALAAVPDDACLPFASAFYAAAWKAPLGEALRRARARLQEEGVHPLVWAAYVLHGDPNAGISSTTRGTSADLVRRWPALATRYLATGTPEHRDALLDALRAAPAAPDVISAWANKVPVAEDDLAMVVEQLLDRDPEGAATCRILLALARLERDQDDEAELTAAILLADALEDHYADLYVLATHFQAIDRLHPGKKDALLGQARWLLATLAGDRAALAPLAARLPSPDKDSDTP